MRCDRLETHETAARRDATEAGTLSHRRHRSSIHFSRREAHLLKEDDDRFLEKGATVVSRREEER